MTGLQRFRFRSGPYFKTTPCGTPGCRLRSGFAVGSAPNKIGDLDAEARQKLEETTRWQPDEAEARIFGEWMEGGYFHPEATGTPDGRT